MLRDDAQTSEPSQVSHSQFTRDLALSAWDDVTEGCVVVWVWVVGVECCVSEGVCVCVCACVSVSVSV